MKKYFLNTLIICPLLALYSYGQVNNDCTGSPLLEKSHLSCMSCALEKNGLPTPDDRFLATLGLVARENIEFLPILAKSPFRLALDSDRVQVAKNKDGSIYLNQGKEVPFTTKNQYHNYVMEMLLASGYCAKENFKPASKGETYENFDLRMKAEKFVSGMKDQYKRYSAARELGASSWEEINDLFFISKAKTGRVFPELSYANQVKEMQLKRDDYVKKNQSLFQSDYSSTTSTNGSAFFSNCFEKLNRSNLSIEARQNQSRVLCNAIYDACEIPRAGDPCGAKYPKVNELPVPKSASSESIKPLPSSENDKAPPENAKSIENPHKGRIFVNDGEPAPIVDRSFNLPTETTIFRKTADGCWYDKQGNKLNLPCTENITKSLPASGNTVPPPSPKTEKSSANK